MLSLNNSFASSVSSFALLGKKRTKHINWVEPDTYTDINAFSCYVDNDSGFNLLKDLPDQFSADSSLLHSSAFNYLEDMPEIWEANIKECNNFMGIPNSQVMPLIPDNEISGLDLSFSHISLPDANLSFDGTNDISLSSVSGIFGFNINELSFDLHDIFDFGGDDSDFDLDVSDINQI